MALLLEETVVEENLQVEISSLPRETQLKLITLEANLDDNLDELNQIVFRLQGVKHLTCEVHVRLDSGNCAKRRNQWLIGVFKVMRLSWRHRLLV